MSIDWRMEKTFNLSKKNHCGREVNVNEKEENIVLMLTLKSNVFTIAAYKVVSVHLRPIDTYLFIDWY